MRERGRLVRPALHCEWAVQTAAKEQTAALFPLAAPPSIGFVPSNSRQGFGPPAPPRISPSTFLSSTSQQACGFRYDETASARLVGLDYFGARYMSSAQGRFTSPDWSATPQPVPYADVRDPPTLNLYAYVRNNPLGSPDF